MHSHLCINVTKHRQPIFNYNYTMTSHISVYVYPKFTKIYLPSHYITMSFSTFKFLLHRDLRQTREGLKTIYILNIREHSFAYISYCFFSTLGLPLPASVIFSCADFPLLALVIFSTVVLPLFALVILSGVPFSLPASVIFSVGLPVSLPFPLKENNIVTKTITRHLSSSM